MVKQKVLYELDDLKLIPSADKGGIYAIMPYERMDKNKKALFKVGLATNFSRRFEDYHTYYPLGFYFKNLLVNPQVDKKNYKVAPILKRNMSSAQIADAQKKAVESSKKNYLKHIENEIFEDIDNHGGQRLLSTTRVKNSHKYLNEKGETEWFYTNQKTLDNAFDNAFEKYATNKQKEMPEKYNYKANLNHINDEAVKNKKGSTYTGEIHYKIDKNNLK